jgi:hypothetical protein
MGSQSPGQTTQQKLMGGYIWVLHRAVISFLLDLWVSDMFLRDF